MRRLVKEILLRSGVLWLVHRCRNRAALTVLMFHRVLPRSDPRYAGANPTYTVSDDEFAACLRFVRRNYSIVSLPDIEAAATTGRLPPCPLLITFDDGWSDNASYALPLLRQHRLPAVVFVATDYIGRRQGFWQEEVLDRLLTQASGRDAHAREHAENNIRELSRLPRDQREAAIMAAGPVRELPRRMADANELATLAGNDVAIGGHGHSHEPLTDVADPGAEVESCRASLDSLGLSGPHPAFSFPHGRYSPLIADCVRAAGFGLCFTSDRCIDPVSRLASGEPIGRFPVDLGPFRRNGTIDIAALAWRLATLPQRR